MRWTGTMTGRNCNHSTYQTMTKRKTMSVLPVGNGKKYRWEERGGKFYLLSIIFISWHVT